MFEKNIEKLKDVLQDSNLNFLIGSGASVPFFSTLGNIENWLTDLNGIDDSYSQDIKDYVKASIYKAYFDVAMGTNNMIRDFHDLKPEFVTDATTLEKKMQNVLLGYVRFLQCINEIIYERRSNTVTKQVNLFTTNIDIFLEKTIEELGLQYNDGFHGVFKKTFSLSNFKKSYFQKSMHYDNISELPVFNLLKMHGSVNWIKNSAGIQFDNLTLIESVKTKIGACDFLDVKAHNDNSWTTKNREITASELCGIASSEGINDCSIFIEEYEKLQIVNPTKEKFKDTTFNKNYYELLRLYANELEKEASILFVIGFSMADEHIREITIRAIKANPTLFVYLCTYTNTGQDIIDNFKKDGFDIGKQRNIKLIHLESDFDLRKTTEKLFQEILNEITKTA